ncbi:unnamed protein product [Choristocarpus tenellus]
MPCGRHIRILCPIRGAQREGARWIGRPGLGNERVHGLPGELGLLLRGRYSQSGRRCDSLCLPLRRKEGPPHSGPSGGELLSSSTAPGTQSPLGSSRCNRRGRALFCSDGSQEGCLASGEAISQATQALDAAGLDEAVLHSLCLNQVRDCVRGDVLSSSGHLKLEGLTLTGMELRPVNFAVEALRRLPLRGGGGGEGLRQLTAAVKAMEATTRGGGARVTLDSCLIATLQRFVPTPINLIMATGALDRTAEIRKVTAFFLRWDSYSETLHRDLQSVAPFFVTVRREIARQGGFLRQFLIDDKGCVMIACWGVPSASHVNDCERAVEAAMGAFIGLAEIGLQTSVGKNR